MKVDIYNTDKKYNIIYADPAWSYGDKQNTKIRGGAIKHYQTMKLQDICDLPIKHICNNKAVCRWLGLLGK